MLPILSGTAGLVVAITGFYTVRQVQKKAKDFTLLALIIYVALTPPIGYFLFGEPIGTQFQYGWLLGASICTLLGFISLSRKGRL